MQWNFLSNFFHSFQSKAFLSLIKKKQKKWLYRRFPRPKFIINDNLIQDLRRHISIVPKRNWSDQLNVLSQTALYRTVQIPNTLNFHQFFGFNFKSQLLISRVVSFHLQRLFLYKTNSHFFSNQLKFVSTVSKAWIHYKWRFNPGFTKTTSFSVKKMKWYFYSPKAKLNWPVLIFKVKQHYIGPTCLVYCTIAKLDSYLGSVDQFIGQAFGNRFNVTECSFTCTSAKQPNGLEKLKCEKKIGDK